MQVGGEGGERMVDSGTTASQGKNILYRPSASLGRAGPNFEPGTLCVYGMNGSRNGLNRVT